MPKIEAVLVCNRLGEPSPFTDNKIGACITCGTSIQFRPYSQKVDTKICMECFNKHAKKGEFKTYIMPETVKEIRSIRKN